MNQYEITVISSDKRAFSAFYEADYGLCQELLVIKGIDALKVMLLANGVSFSSIISCKIRDRNS